MTNEKNKELTGGERGRGFIYGKGVTLAIMKQTNPE